MKRNVAMLFDNKYSASQKNKEIFLETIIAIIVINCTHTIYIYI